MREKMIKYRQGVTPWYRVPWTKASLLLLGSTKRIVETKLKTNCLWRNTSGLHSMYNVMWFGKKKQGMDGYHDDCSLFAGM